MDTILIGYDLDRPGQNYKTLIDKLNEFGSHWHCLDSTWIVKTTMSAIQVRDLLRPLIDATDKILVLNVTNDMAAWAGFSNECSAWLKTI